MMDYDCILQYENYGKEPLIIIIAHQEITKIIVQISLFNPVNPVKKSTIFFIFPVLSLMI